jgi:Zn-dependent M16 (insulinase) family peptidase
MPAFSDYLRALEDCVKDAAGAITSAIDRLSFQMLVDGLKSEDAEAVRNVIDQLVTEGKPAGIPPLYLVSCAHPQDWVRAQAEKGLYKLAPESEIKSLTEGKKVKEAVGILIQTYGHYRN